MAISAGNPAVFFDADVHDQNAYERFARARDGNLGAIASVMDAPNFELDVSCTADADDGAILILNTTSSTPGQGVPFEAGYRRKIRMVIDSKGGGGTTGNRWHQEIHQYVLGGTTPALQGAPLLVDAHGNIGSSEVKYGDVVFQGTVSGNGSVGAVAGGNEAGLAFGDFSSGRSAITSIPPNRAVRALGAVVVNNDSTIDNIDAHALILDVDDAVTTGFLISLTAGSGTTNAAAVNPTDGAEVHLAFRILPPPNLHLQMATASVQVHLDHNVFGSTATPSQHHVKVWVGPAEYDPVA